MALAFLQADRERRQFVQWLRTGRLTGRRLGNGPISPEFKFNPWHDPDDGRFTHAHAGRYFGLGSTPATARESAPGLDGSGSTAKPSQAGASGGYDGPEIVVEAPRRFQDGARRIWPVKGSGTPARKGARGSNGHPYADARFSREGRYRIDAKTGKPRKHLGIDLPGEPGDPVVAAADGVAVLAAPVKDYGNAVRIEHPDGTTTGYADLQTINVVEHSKVRAGQQIGTMGNTGNARGMGTHLHFEVAPPGSEALQRGRRRSDPAHWINTGEHQ